MSTPSPRTVRRWFSVTDRAQKRRLTAYARHVLSELPTLPASRYPSVRNAAILAERTLPELHRLHDAAIRRRRQADARRLRREIRGSDRTLRAVLGELREEAARHQPTVGDWQTDLARAFGGHRGGGYA